MGSDKSASAPAGRRYLSASLSPKSADILRNQPYPAPIPRYSRPLCHIHQQCYNLPIRAPVLVRLTKMVEVQT
jgi:hypothetical protein